MSTSQALTTDVSQFIDGSLNGNRLNVVVEKNNDIIFIANRWFLGTHLECSRLLSSVFARFEATKPHASIRIGTVYLSMWNMTEFSPSFSDCENTFL